MKIALGTLLSVGLLARAEYMPLPRIGNAAAKYLPDKQIIGVTDSNGKLFNDVDAFCAHCKTLDEKEVVVHTLVRLLGNSSIGRTGVLKSVLGEEPDSDYAASLLKPVYILACLCAQSKRMTAETNCTEQQKADAFGIVLDGVVKDVTEVLENQKNKGVSVSYLEPESTDKQSFFNECVKIFDDKAAPTFKQNPQDATESMLFFETAEAKAAYQQFVDNVGKYLPRFDIDKDNGSSKEEDNTVLYVGGAVVALAVLMIGVYCYNLPAAGMM